MNEKDNASTRNKASETKKNGDVFIFVGGLLRLSILVTFL